jgi:hypothetical protein
MTVRFHKNTAGKHTVRFIRNDGSSCHSQCDEFFVLHDLAHHAIETTLGFGTAFLGMIGAGFVPSDFEDAAKRREMQLTDEAWHAEALANLFLMEYRQGWQENIRDIYAQVLASTNPGVDKLELTDGQISDIRSRFRYSVRCWEELPSGAGLDVGFDPVTDACPTDR